MVALSRIFQLILALSVLIVIHETGHFFFARIFGIRVDKFFLFFDVGGVKLFSTRTTKWFTRLFPKMKDSETEYGIGWLPLGGYCKINGMIDESFDLEMMNTEPKPWEFRSRPAWQRLAVMLGGVLFNLLFAIVIYIFMLGIWGSEYISNEGSRIYVNELAYDMGFRTGDHIISFDDYEPEDFGGLQADLARRNVRIAKVLRDADTVEIYIDRNMIGQVLESPGMFSLALPFVIDSLSAGSVNADAGLARGDRVIAIDSAGVSFIQDAWKVLGEKMGSIINAEIVRDGDTLSRKLQVDSAGHIGVILQVPGHQRRDYTAIEAIPAGVKYTFSTVTGYLRDLKLVATPSTGAYKSVGSFVAIGQAMPAKWNWLVFINILALLSIMLGVMNLLPIPALDGGHAAILLYEILTGKKPGDRFLLAAQAVGMILILMLMILAFGNDIGRLLR